MKNLVYELTIIILGFAILLKVAVRSIPPTKPPVLEEQDPLLSAILQEMSALAHNGYGE